ncbi:MAG: RidA family protein [Chloroflexi bacterium]|nr:MAG: RidA family protein [Chloroflexota bacterium]
MARDAVHTDKAPGAIGPYSQAVKANGFVFTAGQIGVDPVTGELAEGIEAQTRQALENIKQVLEAAGTNMDNVVKTTVFLGNIDDFAAMNEVYVTFFSEPRPARSAFQAGHLPRGALVEIETITKLPD